MRKFTNQKISLLVLAFTLMTIVLFGQTGTIKGTITDSQSGDPLPGANELNQNLVL